jgi:hypothetical protein
MTSCIGASDCVCERAVRAADEGGDG